ncbi:MAG: hypothetical protein ACQEQE_02160 [Bacillota bacterium]
MSIRPIDMQTLLPKLQAMKFAKETEINKHNNDLTDLQKQSLKKAKENANKVLELNEKELDKMKNNEKQNSKNQSSNKESKEKEDKKDKENKKMVGKGSNFDMKV